MHFTAKKKFLWVNELWSFKLRVTMIKNKVSKKTKQKKPLNFWHAF